MRREYGYFDKEKKAFVITNNKAHEIWECCAFYKRSKDGVHQEEIWFCPSYNFEIKTEYGPLTKEEYRHLWMLDGGDMYELVTGYEKDGWSEGFYYSCTDTTNKRHCYIVWGKGMGYLRDYKYLPIQIIEKQD